MQVKVATAPVKTSSPSASSPSYDKVEEFKPYLAVALMGSMVFGLLVAILLFQISCSAQESARRCDEKVSELVQPCFTSLNKQMENQTYANLVKFGCCSKYILERCFNVAYNLTECIVNNDLMADFTINLTESVTVQIPWFNFQKREACHKYFEHSKKCFNFETQLKKEEPSIIADEYFGYAYRNPAEVSPLSPMVSDEPQITRNEFGQLYNSTHTIKRNLEDKPIKKDSRQYTNTANVLRMPAEPMTQTPQTKTSEFYDSMADIQINGPDAYLKVSVEVDMEDNNDTEEDNGKDSFLAKDMFPKPKVNYDDSEIDSNLDDDNQESLETNEEKKGRRTGRKDTIETPSHVEHEVEKTNDDADDDENDDEIKELVKNETKDDSVDSGPEYSEEPIEDTTEAQSVASYVPINVIVQFVCLAMFLW